MTSRTEPPPTFTTLDWIGTVVAGFGALGLALFPIAGRTFGSMFRDLGSASQLPALTSLAISWWFPLILALVVATGLVFGVRRTSSIQRRRAWIVAAVILGAAGFALCLVGAYLPILAIADA